MHNQIILGTWEEVSRRHARELAGHQVEIRILDEVVTAKPKQMMYEGMFPELTAITEADFKSAEWRGTSEDL